MAHHLCAALLLAVPLTWGASEAAAQTIEPAAPRAERSESESRSRAAVRFFTGAIAGLAAHESGHVFFDVVFDADPGVKRVDFHGVPFFAITHRPDLSPRREQIVSSAGFWVQHAGSEWILTRTPGLRSQRAPFRKGLLAFNVLTSAAYASAAFARTGPAERDTHGMAQSARIDERWIGAMVLAPAVLDTWRYFEPDARWAAWTSRAVKIGMVLLVLR